jgi:hypothetical protein
MDAFGFVAKGPDEVIFKGTRYQGAAFFDPVAISARVCSRGSKDEIAVRVRHLISPHGLRRDYEVERGESCEQHNTHHQLFTDIHHLRTTADSSAHFNENARS